MEQYGTYKESYVSWVGQIPENWAEKKISHVFTNISSGTTPSTDIDKYYDSGEIHWINTGDLNDGILTDTSKKITRFALEEHSTLKIYPKGSIVIAMYGATIGKTSITDIEACTNQACCALYNSKDVDEKFAFYWFVANKPYLISLGTGGGQPNISQGVIRNLRMQVPSVGEQRRIVAFLDEKTSKVDSIIQQKENLLQKLQAKRQAIISEAITRGFNSSTHLKKSSTIFLDFIPFTWTELKFKYLIRNGDLEMQDGNHGEIHPTADDYVDEGIPFIMANNVKGSEVDLTSCKFLPKEKTDKLRIGFAVEGDVLLTHKGTIGRTAIVGKINCEYLMLTPQVTYYRIKRNTLSNKFLFYFFQSTFFQEQIKLESSGGSTRSFIGITEQKELVFLKPSFEEQEAISNYLDKKLEKIYKVEKLISVQIEKLKMYRNSLISEVVTGKIKVV